MGAGNTAAAVSKAGAGQAAPQQPLPVPQGTAGVPWVCNPMAMMSFRTFGDAVRTEEEDSNA